MKYDAKTKKKVVDFITSYNEANGRGGQTAAAKKFKISLITVGNWLKAAKGDGSESGEVHPKKARSKRSAKAAASGDSVAKLLDRMAEIQVEIDSLQAEFDTLKQHL